MGKHSYHTTIRPCWCNSIENIFVSWGVQDQTRHLFSVSCAQFSFHWVSTETFSQFSNQLAKYFPVQPSQSDNKYIASHWYQFQYKIKGYFVNIMPSVARVWADNDSCNQGLTTQPHLLPVSLVLSDDLPLFFKVLKQGSKQWRILPNQHSSWYSPTALIETPKGQSLLSVLQRWGWCGIWPLSDKMDCAK